jgi:hypothetical protein
VDVDADAEAPVSTLVVEAEVEGSVVDSTGLMVVGERELTSATGEVCAACAGMTAEFVCGGDG